MHAATTSAFSAIWRNSRRSSGVSFKSVVTDLKLALRLFPPFVALPSSSPILTSHQRQRAGNRILLPS
jgi:hypothetical protein